MFLVNYSVSNIYGRSFYPPSEALFNQRRKIFEGTQNIHIPKDKGLRYQCFSVGVPCLYHNTDY